ncbi:hypothetical protein Ahy_B10g101436 [Arachis hypogaea]|uniref:FAR1 domain-containing protein n=1 Tax=Arachis hypogaea TaxID=3818 RepID=A0A444WZH6_ARAHY|nr:hypothetical protein Ahy_B10g101436 [Arachis hypogaea]
MVTSVVNEENLWLRWPSRKRQPVNDTWPERGRRPYPLTLLTYGEIANGVMGSIFSSELSCEWWGEGHLRRPLLEMDSLRKVSEKVSVVGGGDLTRQQHQNQHIRRHLGEKSENPRLCFIIAFPLSPSVPLCLCLSRLENLNPGIRRWLPASSSGPHLFSYLLLLEELHTDEGDSRHVDSEYQDCNGGGCNVDASTEDHGNSGNIIGEQFNSPYPVNGSVLLSAKFTGVEDAYTSYVAYTKDIGFAVRKGDSQGLQEKKHYERVDRKRPYKPETRTNCNAKLVVFLDKSCGKWRTKALVEEHNHDLASPTFTNVITLHRKITEGHKAHIHSMHEAVITTGLETLERSASKFYMREIFYECKDAKVAGSNSKDAASDPTGGFCVRYGALWSAFLSMCFQDAQTTETYNTPMTEVARMSREFESICGIGQSVHRVQAGVDQIHIRYPKVIRSKGAPRGSMNGNNGRHYQRCFRLGHD